MQTEMPSDAPLSAVLPSKINTSMAVAAAMAVRKFCFFKCITSLKSMRQGET